MRSARSALRGAAVVTAASAATVSPLAAGTAQAATGQVSYRCQIFSTQFEYDATVTVTAPASAGVGDRVAVEADFSALPGVAPLPVESWKTSGALTLSGAQTGSVPIEAPERSGPIPPYGEVPIGTVSGEAALTAAGEVKIAPGELTIVADAGAEAAITCTPQGTPPVLATIDVGERGPAASVSPPSVVQGGDIALTGTGWRPGPVEVALCDETGAACEPDDLTGATASADASGALTGSATVAGDAAVGARSIVLAQGTVRARVPLTVTGTTPPPTGECDTEPADTCGEQKINLTVHGGPLTMSREPGEVDLAPVTLNGSRQTTTGSLKRVEVIDARGGTTGWSLTGTLTDFGSAAGTKIPAGNLTWTPSCTAEPGSAPSCPAARARSTPPRPPRYAARPTAPGRPPAAPSPPGPA
ncbi:hypothetical protein BJF79_28705 [Actinomadura sp. CNU-125]|uniref:hypothetical protein n=1 Tax=Actinomadura sp. CNU-125 TaxID=1904961 RepID=UPI00095AF17E|nr:hypothetical protein [Actinomadura sp. CNU-125]OLT37881.1 hypothetical protein BJF79_28705 [Actinomadura sp. CNU-125]